MHPKDQFTLVDDMLQIIKIFDAEGIDYAVCGGLAVAMHGYLRYTNDIDLIIQEKDLERAKSVLPSIGYDLPSGLIPFKQPDGSFRSISRVSKAVGEDLYTLDLMLCTGTLNDAWEDRELMEVEGDPVKVVSKNSLLKMKKEAGRDKDFNDVKELEALKDED